MPTDEQYLKDLIKQGRKIEAIKLLREKDNLGLKDAKEKVEELQSLMVQAGELDPKLAKSGCMVLISLGLGGLFLVF